jgi:hypothetical protein
MELQAAAKVKSADAHFIAGLGCSTLFLRVDADTVLRDRGSMQARDCLHRRCVAVTRRRFPILTVTRMKVLSPARPGSSVRIKSSTYLLTTIGGRDYCWVVREKPIILLQDCPA